MRMAKFGSTPARSAHGPGRFRKSCMATPSKFLWDFSQAGISSARFPNETIWYLRALSSRSRVGVVSAAQEEQLVFLVALLVLQHQYVLRDVSGFLRDSMFCGFMVGLIPCRFKVKRSVVHSRKLSYRHCRGCYIHIERLRHGDTERHVCCQIFTRLCTCLHECLTLGLSILC